jgi:hypothetical protein
LGRLHRHSPKTCALRLHGTNESLLDMWSAADADLPVLREARDELAQDPR